MMIQLRQFLFMASLLLPNVAEAGLVYLEPDNFPDGTDVRSIRPDLVISVNGQPSVAVLTGKTSGCGSWCASTGVKIFGYPNSNPAEWQFGIAEFRADFAVATDFAAIDFVGVDDGRVQAFAFNAADVVVGSFSIMLSGPGHNATASFSRASPDIAYILAGGVPGEGVYLDNLRFNSYYIPPPDTPASAISAPGVLATFAIGLLGVGLGRRRRFS